MCKRSAVVAVLDVTPDATGPILLSAIPDTALTNITVSFTEELDPAGATNHANYTICEAFNAANCIGLVSASMPTANQVILQAAAPIGGGVYRLTVNNNVTDLALQPRASARRA